jgi:hypothetical protein
MHRLLLPTQLVGTTIFRYNQFSHCVDHWRFRLTLLTADYFWWRLTVCTLPCSSAHSLVPRWFPCCTVFRIDFRTRRPAANWSPLSLSLSLWLCHTRLSLKWTCADGRVNSLSHSSYMHCTSLVTVETSVVISHCIAVGLFSAQLTVAWFP